MQPKTENFALYRGDTHLFKVSLIADSQPLDLSLTQFVMDIKAADGSVVSPTISVEGSDVWLLFPSALTSNMPWSRAEYDLRAVTGNVVKTYLRGAVTVSPSISRVQPSNTDGLIHEQTISVNVSGQAVIVQQESGSVENRLGFLEDRHEHISNEIVRLEQKINENLNAVEQGIEYVPQGSVGQLFTPEYFASKPRGSYLSLIHSRHAEVLTGMANEFLVVTTFNPYSQANRLVQQAVGIQTAVIYTRGVDSNGRWGIWKKASLT